MADPRQSDSRLLGRHCQHVAGWAATTRKDRALRPHRLSVG